MYVCTSLFSAAFLTLQHYENINEYYKIFLPKFVYILFCHSSGIFSLGTSGSGTAGATRTIGSDDFVDGLDKILPSFFELIDFLYLFCQLAMLG